MPNDNTPAASPAAAHDLREASRLEEDCEYSGKGHYEDAGRWRYLNYWVGIPATLLALIVSSSAKEHPAFSAGASLVCACLAGVLTFFDPKARAQAHKAAGDAFIALRNQARLFREQGHAFVDNAGVFQRFVELRQQHADINAQSPAISGWAYKRVKKAITDGQAAFRVDRDPTS